MLHLLLKGAFTSNKTLSVPHTPKYPYLHTPKLYYIYIYLPAQCSSVPQNCRTHKALALDPAISTNTASPGGNPYPTRGPSNTPFPSITSSSSGVTGILASIIAAIATAVFWYLIIFVNVEDSKFSQAVGEMVLSLRYSR